MEELLLFFFRNTLYFVQSEPVIVAPDAIDDDVKGQVIPLDQYYPGFEAGRWVIVAGDRTDVVDAAGAPLPGIHAAELRMVIAVDLAAEPGSPGDTPHTNLVLDKPLAYSYKRATATVYGNVVKASHGETVASEALGSGNAAASGQRFHLKRPPLTYVSHPSTSGIRGTETIRVHDVRYRRVESLLDANGDERVYELVDDANGGATLTFSGRLPSGADNVRATYRTGIGREGNVKADQISLLASRPLGVQGVVNPLKATGGADRDRPERIRRNAPLATQVMGPRARLVSVSDYASFALRFAGIGHAVSRKLGGDWVHVTVAGVDDIPLDEDGDLLTGLRNAYREFGDPALHVAVTTRELVALVFQAKVVIHPDYQPDVVKGQIRQRLLDRFSFERSALGQSVYLSDAVAVVQDVRGVEWVDVDVFGGISESVLFNGEALNKAIEYLGPQAEVKCAGGAAGRDDPTRAGLWEAHRGVRPRFLPAQLAYLVPEAPTTLVLNDGRARPRDV
jgi:predicted phage baseplate assembly protein